MTQLQETNAATVKLQESLQPYLKTLSEADRYHSTTQHDTSASNDTNTASSTSEHKKVIVAKAVVALTLATVCYLKPHLLRTTTSSSKSYTTRNTTTPTKTASSLAQKQETQQIRSDLNHIRQLIKKVQECHKRKETSNPPQQSQSNNANASKRMKTLR